LPVLQFAKDLLKKSFLRVFVANFTAAEEIQKKSKIDLKILLFSDLKVEGPQNNFQKEDLK